jgi:hypothetical protein
VTDIQPQPIEVSQEDIDELLKRCRNVQLKPDDIELIQAMGDTIMVLSQSVDSKSQSVQKLLKMIFGHQGEKASDVLDIQPNDHSDGESDGSETEPEDPNNENGNQQKKHKSSDDGKSSSSNRNGCLGADAYTGANTVHCKCHEVKHGDRCPKCSKGKIYHIKPKRLVRISSAPPLSGTIYEKESLRCNTCGIIFTADSPEGVSDEKYDEKSMAMMALLHYGTGMPFNRLENLQASLGIPLPSSTQWDMVSAGSIALHPIMTALLELAAQGKLVHNDDTTAKILELMGKRREKAPPDPKKHKRKGMYTTGIISYTEKHRIALFCTGTHHAGENLEALLKRRREYHSPPIQMCDGLSQNLPGEIKVMLANCLAHSRRKFVEIVENFPKDCRHVILEMAKVYHTDSVAREKNMTSEERLLLHQKYSQKIMSDLKSWMLEKFKAKEVEPNSGLGQAINYSLKRWDALTLFLREAGAPLDNNICERALKKSILTRKNSLFYRSENGAKIGDLYMSIIHTCELEKVSPFEYLTSVMENYDLVNKNPYDWMPWNFQEALHMSKAV